METHTTIIKQHKGRLNTGITDEEWDVTPKVQHSNLIRTPQGRVEN